MSLFKSAVAGCRRSVARMTAGGAGGVGVCQRKGTMELTDLKGVAVPAPDAVGNATSAFIMPAIIENYATRGFAAAAAAEPIQWVFLGPPGVGKGTYSSRVAKRLNVAHIAAGDLVRAEIKSGSERGTKMRETVASGGLLPDDVVMELIEERMAAGTADGEKGFLLDGFPRTRAQAEALQARLPIALAVDLSLAEEILVEKCMGRRVCGACGKNWNVADIRLPASGARPEIVMPPLNPPAGSCCETSLTQRDDDTEPVIRNRLDVYNAEAAPVAAFYRERGLLLDFDIVGGIPETLPRLLSALAPHAPELESN